MTAKDDRKNAEGYNDPTAYNAIKNVEKEKEQDKDDMRFHQLLNTLYCSEEKTRKICTGRKHKSVKCVTDSKMSTYNYKPVVKRNLPYQRRNF